MTEQLAPHSVEGERAVLGSILINPHALPEVCEYLSPDDFYIVRHQWIFEAMLRLHEDNLPIDFLTVCGAVGSRLEEIGGQVYVSKLVTDTPSSLNVEGYAIMVSRMAYRRRLIDAMQQGVRLAHSDDASLVEIHEAISKSLSELGGRAVRMYRSANEVFSEEMGQLAVRFAEAQEGRPDMGWSTGLPELDLVMDGEFRPGAYSVVFGPTKVGKTWLLLMMAQAAAAQGPAVFFSLENGDESIRQRLLALHSGVAFTKIRRGTVNNAEYKQCMASLEELGKLPLELVTNLSSVGQIATHLKAATVRHGQVGIAFVDTINQLADSVGKTGRRYEDLTLSSGRLLNTMRLTGWGMVGSAQLRNDLSPGMRYDNAKEAAYPTLSALEGARTITQHAANLIGMYSPDWVARQINDDNYVDAEVERGDVLLVNVAARDAEGNTDGKLRWNKSVPRYETRGNVRTVDINDMLDMEPGFTHAAQSAPGR